MNLDDQYTVRAGLSKHRFKPTQPKDLPSWKDFFRYIFSSNTAIVPIRNFRSTLVRLAWTFILIVSIHFILWLFPNNWTSVPVPCSHQNSDHSNNSMTSVCLSNQKESFIFYHTWFGYLRFSIPIGLLFFSIPWWSFG